MEQDSRIRYGLERGIDSSNTKDGSVNLTAALHKIERAQLVRRLPDEDPTVGEGRGASYTFKHILTQEAAHASLLMKKRRDLHQLIASAYEGLCLELLDENAPLLVRHYSEAGNHAKVVEFALRAGATAQGVYALREALGQFEQALASSEHFPWAPPLQKYEALLGWAEAAQKLRPYAEQLKRLASAEQIAREVDDDARLARPLFRIGRVHSA
jgi:predicted ATPase